MIKSSRSATSFKPLWRASRDENRDELPKEFNRGRGRSSSRNLDSKQENGFSLSPFCNEPFGDFGCECHKRQFHPTNGRSVPNRKILSLSMKTS